MGNLVLGRKAGQSIRLTHPLREPMVIEVARVTGGGCVLEVTQGGCVHSMDLKRLWVHNLADDVVVTVAELSKGRVKLSFNAPLEVNIVRTEILDRDRNRCNKTLYNVYPQV